MQAGVERYRCKCFSVSPPNKSSLFCCFVNAGVLALCKGFPVYNASVNIVQPDSVSIVVSPAARLLSIVQIAIIVQPSFRVLGWHCANLQTRLTRASCTSLRSWDAFGAPHAGVSSLQRVMSMNLHIEEFLEYYCSLKHDPEYAVLLKGKWGAGKTWFIKNFIDKRMMTLNSFM